MKKTLLFLGALLLSLGAFAQEVTFDFTENAWGIPTDKTVEENSYTANGYTITLQGTSGGGYKYYSDNKYVILGKQGATLTLPSFGFDVEKIEIVGRTGASAGVKQNIYVGEEAVSTETTGAQETNVYEIADNYQKAGNVYVLKVTSKHNTQFTTIKVYKKASTGDLKSAELAWSAASQTVTLGATDNTYPTLTNPNSLSVTYTSSDEAVATVAADGTVSPVALGTTTISAVFAGNTEYAAQTVSYKLTVTKANSATTPYTVAEANQIIASGAVTTDSVYVKGIIVPTPSVSLQYGNADYYISDDGETTGQLKVFRGKYLGGVAFTSEDQIQDGDEVVVYGVLTNYNGTYEFTANNYIYSLNGKLGTQLAWSNTKAEAVVGGEENVYPTLTNPLNLAVTYSSSNEAVATISEAGVVTPVAAGTTTISATFAGDATYIKDVVSYTLTVTATAVDITNTKETAYTVAKAHELINDAVGLDTWVYVKGKVCSVKSLNSTYGSLTYAISDDGTNNDSIVVYGGLNLEQAKFTATTDLAVGDDVVIYGQLYNYNNGTHEINKNNYLVAHTKAVDISNTPETAYDVATALELIEAGQDLKTAVYVKGVIVGTPVVNLEYGNATYTIADNASDTQTLTIFRGNYLEQAKFTEETKNAIVKGSKVVVYGTLVDYNGTPEMNAGNYLISIDNTATGINAISTTQLDAAAPLYNLGGQRVSTAYKGVVIQNGKKFILK